MNRKFWDQRIPTLLGLFIIVLAIGVTSYLVGQNTFFQGHASPTSTPENIRITNITDTSVTISYTTPGYVLGTLNFGKDTTLGQTVTDDKDKNQIKEHKIHSFSINNLSPSAKYYFSITSGQESFLNNGAPYQLTTGPNLKSTGNVGFIVGKVVSPEGKNPNEAEVFATSDGVSPLSTNIKNDGTYTISLENLRKEDLSSFLSLKSSSIIKLLVISDTGSSSIQIQAKGINNVPVIVLSQDYDFAESETPTPTPTSSDNFPKVVSGKSGDTPKILTPSDNQNISNQKPVFTGVGIPNDKVKILIQSDQVIQTDVTVDSSGNWSFQPTTLLAPGQHTITITGRDALGILRTISRTFTVTAAEASLATTPLTSPTPTPTPTPSPSPTPSATPMASSSTTNTPVPTLSPTTTPLAVATPTPISSVQLPPTGSNDIPTGILGISAALAGGIFLLISKLLL